jgi:dihydroorotate dehydrogenase electron transfer subunit
LSDENRGEFAMAEFSTPSGFAKAQIRPGEADPHLDRPDIPAGDFVSKVIANDWVNDEYKLIVVDAPARALTAKPGQFFQWECPSPDGTEMWTRRPMSIYRIDRDKSQLQFLYKLAGRGTKGVATLEPGDEFPIAGPFGVGFKLDPAWRNIVVIGRGVGLATLGPLSQLAAESDVGVTAILSARSAELAMSADVFETMGATVIPVLDTDGSSDVANVENIIEGLIADGKVDAFFTCGSNRLLKLCQELGQKHGIGGEVAMEQIMACGYGPCYICVKTFVVDGKKVLRRVCRDGPVFNIHEATGW